VYLESLQTWVEQNRDALEAVAVTVSLSEPTQWEKPGQGVVLSRSGREGEVLVWASGECEVSLGDAARSADPTQTHHDLASSDELLQVLNAFRDEFLET
jgi:hypothetical protein